MEQRPSSARLARQLAGQGVRFKYPGSQSARTPYPDATKEQETSGSPEYEVSVHPRTVALNYIANQEAQILSPRRLTTALPGTPQREEDEVFHNMMSSEDEVEDVAATVEDISYDEETIVFIDDTGKKHESWNDTIDLKEIHVKRGNLTLRCTLMHTHMCSGIQGENIREAFEVYTIFCTLADQDANGVQGANLFFEYETRAPTTRFVIPFRALPIKVRDPAQKMLDSLCEMHKPDNFFLPKRTTIETMIDIERFQLGIKERRGRKDNQKIIVLRPRISLPQDPEVVRSLQNSIEGSQDKKELNVVLDTSVVVNPTLIALYETFLAAKRQTPVTVYTQLSWDTFANENLRKNRKDPVVTRRQGEPWSKLKKDVDRILAEIDNVEKTSHQSTLFQSFKNTYKILNNQVEKNDIDDVMVNELNELRRKCSIGGMFKELYKTEDPPEFLVHTQTLKSKDKGLISKTYILFLNFNTSENRFLVLTNRLWVSEDMSMSSRTTNWI